MTEQVALACWWLLIYSSEMGLSFMGRGLLIAASKVGDLEWEIVMVGNKYQRRKRARG